jgi:hypothetical protein
MIFSPLLSEALYFSAWLPPVVAQQVVQHASSLPQILRVVQQIQAALFTLQFSPCPTEMHICGSRSLQSHSRAMLRLHVVLITGEIQGRRVWDPLHVFDFGMVTSTVQSCLKPSSSGSIINLFLKLNHILS